MNLNEIQQTVQMQAILGIIEMVVMVFILIFLIYLILRLSNLFRKQDNERTISEKILEKRIAVYDIIAVKLYHIMCFFLYTGNWVEISPVEILRLKRELDRDTNIYGPLFDEELVGKFQEFHQQCFISASGWEQDVKIKSLYDLRVKHNMDWEEDWAHYFDTNNVVEAIQLKEKYDKLIDSFKQYLLLI
jgi:hypothetical protein